MDRINTCTVIEMRACALKKFNMITVWDIKWKMPKSDTKHIGDDSEHTEVVLDILSFCENIIQSSLCKHAINGDSPRPTEVAYPSA